MSRRPLRAVLLSLSYPPDPGGGGIQLAQLAERLVEQDVEVTVLVPTPHQGIDPEPSPGITIRRLERPHGGGGRAWALGLRWASQLLRIRDWDILHVSGFFPAAAVPVLLARALGRPVLIKVTELPPGETFRGPRSPFGRVALSLLRGATRIVAISAAIDETLAAAGVPPERIARIPNGVDTERFRPATDDERARLKLERSWPDADPVVLCCGVLSRRKNALAVVRAMGRLGSDAVTLVLAGPDPPDPEYLRELDVAVSALPPTVRVERTGRLDSDDLPRVIRAADVVVHASRFEGLPNVLLESLASGVPCVATAIPGSSDVLEAGGGVLVPPDDDSAMAAAIGGLLADASRRRNLGAEGCRLARERYSLVRVAGLYRALYDELVSVGR
jgi:glycosyltransferase involved in cell wall biosynthesis